MKETVSLILSKCIAWLIHPYQQQIKLIEDFKSTIQEGPIYICDICSNFEFRRNFIKLKELKYQADI